jgi:chromosome segregation ATPase
MNVKLKTCLILCFACLFIGAVGCFGIGYFIFARSIKDAGSYNAIKDDYKRLKDNESAIKERIQSLTEQLDLYKTTVTAIIGQFGKIDNSITTGSGIVDKQSILIGQLDEECNRFEQLTKKGNVLK